MARACAFTIASPGTAAGMRLAAATSLLVWPVGLTAGAAWFIRNRVWREGVVVLYKDKERTGNYLRWVDCVKGNTAQGFMKYTARRRLRYVCCI